MSDNNASPLKASKALLAPMLSVARPFYWHEGVLAGPPGYDGPLFRSSS